LGGGGGEGELSGCVVVVVVVVDISRVNYSGRTRRIESPRWREGSDTKCDDTRGNAGVARGGEIGGGASSTRGRGDS